MINTSANNYDIHLKKMENENDENERNEDLNENFNENDENINENFNENINEKEENKEEESHLISNINEINETNERNETEEIKIEENKINNNKRNKIEINENQLNEEKRLREEVKKSFEKASSLSQSCHVRIDNFQRPLTLKTLILWLEEKLNLKVDESNVWVNSIKTHCYISFQSIEESNLCKEKIEGLKYPLTNPLSLVVNYTKLSATNASKSPEAALKYQDWLTSSHVSSSSSSSMLKRLGQNKERIVVQTENSTSSSFPSPTGLNNNTNINSSSLGKRKSLSQSGSGIGSGVMFGMMRNTLQNAAAANAQELMKSPRIDKHTTPRGSSQSSNVFIESFGSGEGNNESEEHDHQTNSHSHSHNNNNNNNINNNTIDQNHQNKKNRNNSTKLKISNLNEQKQQQSHKIERKVLGLDDFFKKTIATPQLYWLPIHEDEVEKRRQQKINDDKKYE